MVSNKLDRDEFINEASAEMAEPKLKKENCRMCREIESKIKATHLKSIMKAIDHDEILNEVEKINRPPSTSLLQVEAQVSLETQA